MLTEIDLIGQEAAKRDKGLALTTFLREAWDQTKEEVIAEARNSV